MKAWRVHEFGDYRDVLKWEDTDMPVAGGPTSIIRVDAAAVNFPDLLFISGTYQIKPPLPFTPGLEAVGTVVETTSESKFEVGDRVVTNGIGAFAEYQLAIDQMTAPAPQGMPDRDAAAYRIVSLTVHLALVRRAKLQYGEWLVVHGGSGGVGTAAIQIGKALGAHVIATTHGEDHAQVCRDSGADHVLDYRDDDIVTAVKDFTSGRGADVIIDPVGGDAFEASTHCIAFEGRIVIIGFASGTIGSVKTSLILNKNIDVLGMYATNYELLHPDILETAQNGIDTMYARGDIRPVISHELDMAQLPDALDALTHHENYGKIVLTNK